MLIQLKKLYVGNLPWSVSNDSLLELFSKYSPTNASIIIDKQTGRSRGFGFVEISDDALAQQAINEMNEADVDGRKLVVNEARPRDDNNNFRGAR